MPPFKVDHGPLTIDHKQLSMVDGLSSAKNKKPFIHIRDEELTPRYHPNYVFKLERSSASTFKPSNVTLVALTGVPVDDYFVHHPSLSFEITGEFGLILRSLGRCAGLPPHFPNSLTG